MSLLWIARAGVSDASRPTLFEREFSTGSRVQDKTRTTRSTTWGTACSAWRHGWSIVNNGHAAEGLCIEELTRIFSAEIQLFSCTGICRRSLCRDQCEGSKGARRFRPGAEQGWRSGGVAARSSNSRVQRRPQGGASRGRIGRDPWLSESLVVWRRRTWTSRDASKLRRSLG